MGIQFEPQDVNRAAAEIIAQKTIELHLAEQMILGMQKKIDDLQGLVDRITQAKSETNGHKKAEDVLPSPVEG